MAQGKDFNGRNDKHRNPIKRYGGRVHYPKCGFTANGGKCWCTLRGKKIIKKYWFFIDEGNFWCMNKAYRSYKKWRNKYERERVSRPND